ncbi:MAG: hypothetical protein QG654_286 [Patescibacteria group bacterium]|nr:hypothetical protein [Patescibacteria group bacterium]
MEILPIIEKKENYDSAVSLRFFRHGDRDKILTEADQKRLDELVKDGWSGEKDYLIKLNEIGRKQAHEGGDENPNISQSVAFGGPRERSAETAMRVMVGHDSSLGDEGDSFEDFLTRLNNDRKLGSKVGFNEKLNYIIDQNEETGKELVKNFGINNGLKWLVNESDRVAKDNGDKNTSTYSMLAGNIASLVDKYYKASDRWNELASDKSKSYEKELKRFLGTHGTITESFLAKVIDKTEGRERRDEFLDIVGGNGFDFVEGIKVRIENKGGKKAISIEYEKELPDDKKFEFKKEINNEILEEIIGESLK